MKPLLIIAGLDPTGNAGILRDFEIARSQKIKTAGIVSALTAQSDSKFYGMKKSCSSEIKKQLKALSPLNRFGAVKIGMLGNAAMIQDLAHHLKTYKGWIVVDPVLKSSSGGKLMSKKETQ